METILITGATGFIGFRSLQYALEKGYHVRAAVRSQEKAEALRAQLVIAAMKDRLEFVVVPDITTEGAYDQAVRGVEYVVHMASPLPPSDPDADPETTLIQPAVKGTLNMLQAASKELRIKRIVITSSIVAIVPFLVLAGLEQSKKVYRQEDRGPDVPTPYPLPFAAYVQSKIAALRAGEIWMQENRSSFDVITIHPSFVGGRNEAATTTAELLSGTNGLFLGPVLAQKGAVAAAPALVATCVDVDDVAKAHIESLRDDIAGSQAFLLTNKGGDYTWNDAKEVVKRHFREAVVDGRLPNGGNAEPHFTFYSDITKTEDTFGKLKTFEETVVGLTGQYLKLLAGEMRV